MKLMIMGFIFLLVSALKGCKIICERWGYRSLYIQYSLVEMAD